MSKDCVGRFSLHTASPIQQDTVCTFVPMLLKGKTKKRRDLSIVRILMRLSVPLVPLVPFVSQK